MSMFLDILLLVLAIAVILKLRAVLGQRTGFERHRSTEFNPTPPLEGSAPAPTTVQPLIVNDVEESARRVLDSLSARDKNFSVNEFLKGARIAYQMIVEAFAKGDMDVLKNLLKQNVAERFQAEIERRKDKNHTANTSVKKILRAHIITAVLKTMDEKEEAQITVEMDSRQLAWVEDEEGRIISGDPNTPREMKDVWTFTRQINHDDPNWRLMATSAVGAAR